MPRSHCLFQWSGNGHNLKLIQNSKWDYVILHNGKVADLPDYLTTYAEAVDAYDKLKRTLA